MGIGFRYQYQDSGNERSKRKRLRLLGRIRNVCPHIHTLDPTTDDAGNPAIAVHYAFETFIGTMDYFCMMCHSRWSQHRIDLFQSKLMTAIQHDHSGATSDILERSKQTDKLIRKLNRLGGAPSKG